MNIETTSDVEIAEDFWLGLQKIHSLTQQGIHILRLDFEDWKEEKHWAEYHFLLDGPSKDYSLQVSNFSGDLPDALANSTGTSFSTKDRNNDHNPNSNCSYAGRLPTLCGTSYGQVFPIANALPSIH